LFYLSIFVYCELETSQEGGNTPLIQFGTRSGSARSKLKLTSPL